VERDNKAAFDVWITGLPASGKSTVAGELAKQIRDLGIQVTILESDEMRKLFSAERRYDEQDREYSLQLCSPRVW
jgi:adenylylsulfate kinase